MVRTHLDIGAGAAYLAGTSGLVVAISLPFDDHTQKVVIAIGAGVILAAGLIARLLGNPTPPPGEVSLTGPAK
jgi:predicted regulator of Ras-like GTPase activity (Roadblock/LC7/MglB family)